MGDLAEALVLDRSALAHNLKPLERDGLIEIVVDNEDRRSRRVKITKRGFAKLNVSVEGWQTAQRCFETVVGSKEATALRSVLATIASAEFAEKFDHALRS
jgi:DNA-binding MarR family transcriptional regulator